MTPNSEGSINKTIMAVSLEQASDYVFKTSSRSTGILWFSEIWKEVEKDIRYPSVGNRISQLLTCTLMAGSELFLPSTSRIIENLEEIQQGGRKFNIAAQTFGAAVLADVTTLLAAWSLSDSLASFALIKAGMNIPIHVGLDTTRSVLEKIKGEPLLVDPFQSSHS